MEKEKNSPAGKEPAATGHPAAKQAAGPAMLMQRTLWRLTVLGVASALTLDLVILASIALSPWFILTNTSLSELGNTLTNGRVAFLFDAGLGLAGLLMFAFAVLISYRARDRRLLIWTVPLAITAVDLAMVGAFPENTPGLVHRIVSGVLFLMIAITLLAYGPLSWSLGRRLAGSIALLFGLFTAFIWITTWPWSGVVNQWSVWPWLGVSIQESLTAGMLTTWLVMVALKLNHLLSALPLT
jgi:hypothetical membrane protein